jgi:hypothetical protein
MTGRDGAAKKRNPHDNLAERLGDHGALDFI